VKVADNISVEISVVLGKAVTPIHQLLKMDRGAVIELDSAVHDTALLYANNRLLACGDITGVEDHVAVSITETVGALRSE